MNMVEQKLWSLPSLSPCHLSRKKPDLGAFGEIPAKDSFRQLTALEIRELAAESDLFRQLTASADRELAAESLQNAKKTAFAKSPFSQPSDVRLACSNSRFWSTEDELSAGGFRFEFGVREGRLNRPATSRDFSKTVSSVLCSGHSVFSIVEVIQ